MWPFPDQPQLTRIIRLLIRLDRQMADLTTSVTDLDAAVKDVADRVAAGFGPLQDALTAANDALAALQVVDDADKQALADALTSAQAAADAIEGDVTTLSGIAAVPASPSPAEAATDAPKQDGPQQDAPKQEAPAEAAVFAAATDRANAPVPEHRQAPADD